MEFRTITEMEWNACYDLPDGQKKIQSRAERIVGALQTAFASSDAADMHTTFGPLNQDLIATVQGPAASGRLRLGFRFLGGILAGRFVVERPDPSSIDGRWEAVWSFGVGSGYGGLPDLWGGDDPKADDADLSTRGLNGKTVFGLGMSILFAIVHGPVVKKAG